MRKFLLITSTLAIGICVLNACSSLSTGRYFQLKKTSFDQLHGFNDDNFKDALPAMLKSCKTAPKNLHDFCRGLPAYQNASSDEIKAYITSKLTPYIASSHSKKVGTITGYYEPVLTGSRTRTKSTQVPIYGIPSGFKAGKTYAKRADIERKGINAPIIAWADDPVDLFILHIQGSGRLITPTEEIKIGYAGNNNREFKGLGSILQKTGIKGVYSMPDMRAWLKKHPQHARQLMAQNDRFIFFRETFGESPYGAAGVVLTPGRSIAVDNRYIPMHTLMWLQTSAPSGYQINKLVVAQDVGTAIKGGIRADYFWGLGEKAFYQAGRMKSKGQYYLLLPKK